MVVTSWLDGRQPELRFRSRHCSRLPLGASDYDHPAREAPPPYAQGFSQSVVNCGHAARSAVPTRPLAWPTQLADQGGYHLAGHLSISLSEYSARIRFCGAGRLAPDIGATLRGGFGKALKDICCVHTGTKCPECLLGWRCAYGYLFETPVPPDSPMMRRYTHAPHPFVLRPPLDHSAQIEEPHLRHLTEAGGPLLYGVARAGSARSGELPG